MIKKKLVAVVAGALGAISLAPVAVAGVCQVQSTAFYVRQYCGLTSRGYGEGTTAFGQKALLVNSTGTPGGAASVGAAGVSSGGALLNGCKPFDNLEDNQPVATVGGDCNSAVTFYVNVNY